MIELTSKWDEKEMELEQGWNFNWTKQKMGAIITKYKVGNGLVRKEELTRGKNEEMKLKGKGK